MQIAGKVCVVTGGAAGIGRALAARFVSDGAAAVVVADVNATALAKTASEIGAHECVTDVSDEQSIVALIESTEEQHGPTLSRTQASAARPAVQKCPTTSGTDFGAST